MPSGFKPGDLARVHKRIGNFTHGIEGPGMLKRLKHLADLAANDADEAVRDTLGDMSMSNWRRGAGNQIPITSYGRVIDGYTVAVRPKGRAAGPMRVLESGRRAATKGDTRDRHRRSKKTGELKTYKRKIKRTSGATGGKGTWSHAVALMGPRSKKRMNAEISASFKQAFGGRA